MTGLADLVKKTGVVAQVVGEPSVFDIVFTDRPVVDYRAVLTNDGAKLRRFNETCLQRGVLKGGSKIYVSTAHDEADVEKTLAAFGHALEAVARM
jgi:glutamate-1-semialdehyde 2,1-aminomutase